MKIGIITTHNFPIPSPCHTGEFFILGLVRSLREMGHEISLFTPKGTKCFPNVNFYEMPCSFGKVSPSSIECEQSCFNSHANILRKLDIIHDFSITKQIAENLFNEGYRNIISTPLGGTWDHPNPAYNIVCSSYTMRSRGLRGATDYENTPMPDFGGKPFIPIKDARVVYYGINTDWYTPTYDKKDFFLWLGRWHNVRGYHMAIELAKKTGINLIMAGEHPDRELFDYQKHCVLEAIELAKDVPNIKFEWLPPDPDHHTKKRELLRQAKAYLCTTQFCEPFGLTQAEALACGTPIIATNYGSMPEIITNGITGYICENNIKDFSIALKMIGNIDPETCREHAVLRFDRKVMAKAYLAEYEAVINGRNWGL